LHGPVLKVVCIISFQNLLAKIAYMWYLQWKT
jgi:hypothetical protein